MKLRQLSEAKYAAPKLQSEIFVIAHEGDEDLVVGPFATADDAHDYIAHMESRYGDLVALNLEITASNSPKGYEEDIAAHHKWISSED